MHATGEYAYGNSQASNGPIQALSFHAYRSNQGKRARNAKMQKIYEDIHRLPEGRQPVFWQELAMITHLNRRQLAVSLCFGIFTALLLIAAGCHSSSPVPPGDAIRIQSGKLTDVGGTTVLYSRKFNFYIESLPSGWNVSRQANEAGDVLDMELAAEAHYLRAALQILPMDSETEWHSQFDETRSLLQEAGGSVVDVTAYGPGNLVWKGYRSRANGLLRFHYSLYRHGVTYDLEVWQTASGSDSDDSIASSQAEALVSVFNLINPTAFVYSSKRADGVIHDSPIYGYRIVGKAEEGALETGLLQTIRESSQLIDYTTLSNEGFFFAVAPLWLGDLHPTPEALTTAMGALFGASANDVQQRGRNGFFPSGLPYREVTRDVEMGAKGAKGMHVLRVTQSENYGYLLIAFVPPGYPQNIVARVRAFMDGFEIRPVHEAFRNGPQYGVQERAEAAVIFNNLSLFYISRGDLARGEPFIARAWELEGSSATLLNNYVDCLMGQGKFKEAEALLSKAGKLLNTPEVRSRLAFAQQKLGRPKEALENYSQAVTDGLLDEGTLVAYGYLLIEQGQAERARRLLTPLAKYLSSDHLKIVIAKSYTADGDPDRTERELKLLRKNMPQTPDIAWQLFQHYLDNSRPEEILALAEDLRDEISSPYLDYYSGVASYLLQDFEAAAAYFNKAAEANLNEPEMKRWVGLSDAAIGRNSAMLFSKTPIEAVAAPEAIKDVVNQTPPAHYLSQFGAWHSYTGESIYFEPGKPVRHTYYYNSHAHSAAGVSTLDEIHIPFVPLFDEACVNTLKVYAPDGSLINDGDVTGAYLMDDNSTGLITLRKILVIPIRGLQPGGRFELTVTTQSVGAPPEMPFKHIEMHGSLPRLLSFTRFEGATDKILFADSEGVNKGKLRRTVTSNAVEWLLADPVETQYGRFLPAMHDIYPAVWIGARTSDWAALGKDYLKRLKDFLEPDPLAAKTAQEITEGLTDPFDIISALTRYIQDNYAYRGVLFGVRAQIPNSVPFILNSKSGDCKDLSILLRQLLLARGIEANITLVNTREWLFDQMPTLDQFDHMILHIPALGEQPFLDPTERQLPVGLIPPHLSGLRTIVLDEDGPFIATIPISHEADNKITVERDITLDSNDNVTVKESVAFGGYESAALRYFLRNANPKDYALAIRHTLGERLPTLSFGQLVVLNLDDRHSPLVLTYEYSLPRFYLSKAGSVGIGQLPASWEICRITAEPEDYERKAPYRVRHPLNVSVTNRYHLPDGWEIEEPERTRPGGSYLNFASQWSRADGYYLEGTSLSLLPQILPASEGGSFLQALIDAEKALQPILIIRQR